MGGAQASAGRTVRGVLEARLQICALATGTLVPTVPVLCLVDGCVLTHAPDFARGFEPLG